MFEIYLVGLAAGGTLLAVSLVFGGDSEVEVDSEIDVDADGGHVALGDLASSWLPLTSIRFWTFFLAFFGLTGLVLDVGGLLAEAPAIAVAIAVGYVSGLVVTRVLRRLRSEVVDSGVSADDWIGEIGTVVVALAPGKTGKVRLSVKGRVIERLAECEDESIDVRSSVVVYAVKEDGRVIVSRSGRLTDSSGN